MTETRTIEIDIDIHKLIESRAPQLCRSAEHRIAAAA